MIPVPVLICNANTAIFFESAAQEINNPTGDIYEYGFANGRNKQTRTRAPTRLSGQRNTDKV